MRKRQQKGPRVHYLIAVNKNAANYTDKAVRQLTGAIRRQNGYYTVMEPDSPENLQSRAREFCRLKRRSTPFPPPIARRGKVTGIIAAGGDGTVNAAAKVAVEANLPLGILPMGRFNDIASSLCKGPDARKAIKAIINRQ